ncbi:MAG: hypothetical protein ABSA26_16790 [Thermoguttaceae bacterium]|jgi:hypothetical protein
MSKLKSLIGQTGNVIQSVLEQFFARWDDFLAKFLARLNFKKACIYVKIHQGQIVAVTRSHTTNFTLAGDVQQGNDPINIELRRRLSRIVQASGIEHGLLKIDIEDGSNGSKADILLGIAHRITNF